MLSQSALFAGCMLYEMLQYKHNKNLTTLENSDTFGIQNMAQDNDGKGTQVYIHTKTCKV